jgi:Domain of unknown function (DUF6379)
MKNTFSDVLVRLAPTRCTPGHLVLELRLPWYRTLPLSVVEVTSLEVDGDSVPLANATLELECKSHALSAMHELTEVQWFVQDSAYLHVELPDFEPNSAHEAALLIKLYPPYIPMLVWVTRGTTKQEATA